MAKLIVDSAVISMKLTGLPVSKMGSLAEVHAILDDTAELFPIIGSLENIVQDQDALQLLVRYDDHADALCAAKDAKTLLEALESAWAREEEHALQQSLEVDASARMSVTKKDCWWEEDNR